MLQTLHIVQRTSFQLQTKNPVQSTKYKVRCTTYNAQCTLHEVRCTLYIARRSKMQFDFKHCHDTLYSHLGIVLLLQGRSHNPPIAFLRQFYGYTLLSRRDIF